MKDIRFQADRDLNEIIIRSVVRLFPILDFQTARMAGIGRMADPDVLAFCSGQGRVLVSHDLRTMPSNFGTFIALTHSPGLIIVPQSISVHQAVEEVLMIWSSSSAEEWTNRIVVLPI